MTTSIGVIILAVTVGFSVVCLKRPIWALALLVMMWATEQLLQSYLPFLRDRSILFNGFVAIIVGLAAVRNVIAGRASLQAYFNPALASVTGLYLLGIASLAWTRGAEFGTGQVLWLGPYIIVGVYLAPLLVHKIEDLSQFRMVLMVGGTAICLALLLNPNFKFYGDRAMLILSTSEDRGNPLAVAELGSIVALIAALSRDRGVTGFKVLIRAAIVIIGLGLALQTGSRGQVIAAVGTLVILYPLAKRGGAVFQQIVTLVGLFVIVGMIYLSVGLFVGSENEKRWDLTSLTEGTAGRLAFVTSYLGAWVKSPDAWILGFGTGSFSAVSPDFNNDFVENLFAEVVFELGIAGLLLLIPTLVAPIRASAWMITNAPDAKSRINATALLGMWIVYALIAAKSFNLWTGFPFFYMSVIIAKCGRIARDEWLEEYDEEYEEGDEYEGLEESEVDDDIEQDGDLELR